MPGPTFFSDKCQEDKCLNPQVQAFVHRGICPLLAFVLRGICLLTGGEDEVVKNQAVISISYQDWQELKDAL